MTPPEFNVREVLFKGDRKNKDLLVCLFCQEQLKPGGLQMEKHTPHTQKGQGGRQQSEVLADLCYRFGRPLLEKLYMKLDRRLVQTMLNLMIVIVIHRHRNHGLLLSELGGYLLNGEHAPAGTKRIHNLLRHPGWEAQAISDYLWQQADQAVQQRQSPQDDVYVIWDESVIEKSESLKPEHLCAVRSSKARRLKRIKPGYYNPPGGRPIFVPGFNWLQVLVTGIRGLQLWPISATGLPGAKRRQLSVKKNTKYSNR